MTSRISALLLASGALAAPALAQNDECASAATLSLASVAFDTTTATLSPETWPCASAGGPDLWYRFTAGNEATYTFDTCGSAFDTALQVLSGACGSQTSLACNDDSCGTQSSLSVVLPAGGVVYVRVGGFAGTVGTGTLNVTETIVPGPTGSVASWQAAVNAGTTALYSDTLVLGPVVEDIGSPTGATSVTYEFIVYGNNTGASTALMGNLGSGVGSSAGLKFEQWNNTLQYGVTEFGVVDHVFPGGQNTESVDLQLVFVANIATDTTELFVNGVSFGTTPFAPLLQGLQGIGQIYRPTGVNIDPMPFGRIRGVAVYDAALPLAEIVAHRNAYFTGSLGTNYCSPAVVNSSGQPAVMSATGSTVASANNLTLRCGQMPNNSFGFFLTSRSQGTVNQPGGSLGVLCLSGAIGRYVGPGQIKNSGTSGAISLLTNLTQHPTPTGLVTVIAGDTWNFQAWFRDVVAGQARSNFSNGLRITFQ